VANVIRKTEFRLYLVGTIALLAFLLADAPLVFGQRDLREIPDPDPELERATFVVPDGFEVSLWCSDPRIAKPIQMNFDARGRLWIASSEVYPQIKPGQAASDKILVVEDSDFDGVADTTTVFASGLLIPTGVLPGDGGVYVANSTELLHFRDRDGDGKADQQQVVLSGFGTEDTHHMLHSLRWGPDGCIYMNQSIYIHSHVETPYGVKRLLGGGIWRFRPETMELDVYCRGFVNSWGFQFDAWGQSFATDGAYGEGINYAFPGAVFFSAVDAKRILTGLNPGSPKHCGLEIVSGRQMPSDWSGSIITNDFRAHRVCRFVVTEDGAGFASRQEIELIKSRHPAFRPVDVKMGPDGAIYVADWYNPIIQHGEVDFRDPRRDHTHGRIWRVSVKGVPGLRPPEFHLQSIDELLAQLRAPEDWTRLHAKLTLKQREPDQVESAVHRWLASIAIDDPQGEQLRLEALWVLQATDRPDSGMLVERLRSPSHQVRAAAVRVLAEWMSRGGKVPRALELLRSAVADGHPRVRLEAVRALAVYPRYFPASSLQLDENPAALALTVLDRPIDRFLDFALWQAMRDLESNWLPAVREGRFDFGGNIHHLTFALKAVESPDIVEPLLGLIRANRVAADRLDGILSLVASLGGPEHLGEVLEIVVATDSRLPDIAKAALLTGVVDAAQQRKIVPSGDLRRISVLLRGNDAALQAAAVRAVGRLRIDALRPAVVRLALREDPGPDEARLAAVEALGSLGAESDLEILSGLALPGMPDRVAAIRAIGGANAKRGAELAVEFWANTADPAANIAVALRLLDPLLVSKDGEQALFEALAGREIPADLARSIYRAIQASPVSTPELLERIRQAGRLAAAAWTLQPELVDALRNEVVEVGDAGRGELVYRRADLQCQKCHAIAGAGGRVGPDLASIGGSAPIDYLIESVIAPNRKIKENYHSIVIATDDGQIRTGIPLRESASELVLRDADDRQLVVPTSSIESRKEGKSLMPEGAVDGLTRRELVDLVRFLSELGKVGPYSVGPARLVRRWQVLAFSAETHHVLRRSSYDTAALERSEFQWLPWYSLVSGRLPVDDLPAFIVQMGQPRTAFLRCQLEVTTAGDVQLQFDPASGITAWLDGSPTPLDSGKLSSPLSLGLHTLTLAVEVERLDRGLRVELVDQGQFPAQVQIVGGR